MTDDVAAGTIGPKSTPGVIDWGLGEYERSAGALVPAAKALVETAHLVPGEHVLDLGCGTGTVALMAARAGAVTLAVDPAARLLEVARTQAADERLDIEFLPGEAASLPLPEGAVNGAPAILRLARHHGARDALRDPRHDRHGRAARAGVHSAVARGLHGGRQHAPHGCDGHRGP